ncbi:MAG: histidine kinase [Burkholderiaceae bacterium]|nr:histidine kinase [Burkholderiaceae bacterium]
MTAATTAQTALRRWGTDLWWVVAATLACYGLSIYFELTEFFFGKLAKYERWQIDELPLTVTVLAVGLAWYSFRRGREARVELHRREQAEARIADLLAHNRELSRQLINVQESERLALARELHDELGQGCSAIRVETAFIRHCTAAHHADAMRAAARADDAAQGLYQLVRGMLRRLRPANLDSLGLVAALQELCESWEERSGIDCAFHHTGLSDSLGDATDIAVYRVTQEALTNVMRHARASSVRVMLSHVVGTGTGAPGVRLSIQDDGQGMDTAASTRGLGLLGASERAAGLGGELQVESTPGHGVQVSLYIPLSAPMSGAIPADAIQLPEATSGLGLHAPRRA